MQKKENWKYDRMKNSFKKKGERMKGIERKEKEIPRWKENKQLIRKGLGWRCREKAAAAFPLLSS